MTDLDNTLYDWVAFFVPALYAMAVVTAELFEEEIDVVLDNLQAVHRRFGSVEEPFALMQTDLVVRRLANLNAAERKTFLDPAFYAFNKNRKKLLVCYDGVVETLMVLKELEIPVVALTDANPPNALFRIEKLKLAGLISSLYALKSRSEKSHRFQSNSIMQIFAHQHAKPDPSCLVQICLDQRVDLQECIYIGDSLFKDIGMAQAAGVRSAWAEYGTRIDPKLLEMLVRITHWQPETVGELYPLLQESRRPDFILASFKEVLRHID